VFHYLVVAGVLAILAAGGYAVYFFYFKSDASKSASGARPAPVVTAETATAEKWSQQISAVGTVTPVQGTELTSELAGKVEKIHFRSGQQVEVGKLLIELDASSEEAELGTLRPQLRQAKADQTRAEKLIGTNAISEVAYEETIVEVDRLQAAIRQREAIINRKKIRAPFRGELGIRMVSLGQYVSPGTPVVTLQQISPIYVDFDIPEGAAGNIATGQQVQVLVAAYPDQPFQGEISAITPRVARGTRSFRVRATLSNAERKLKPGMFADVLVRLPGERRVIAVPQTAIAFNAYGSSLFVIQHEGEKRTVNRTFVETGERRGLDIEIVNGIEAGDRVVTAGQLKISDGDAVTISEEEVDPRHTATQMDPQ
jgi:membrane fusion protein (multidrug efflux system)